MRVQVVQYIDFKYTYSKNGTGVSPLDGGTDDQ